MALDLYSEEWTGRVVVGEVLFGAQRCVCSYNLAHASFPPLPNPTPAPATPATPTSLPLRLQPNPPILIFGASSKLPVATVTRLLLHRRVCGPGPGASGGGQEVGWGGFERELCADDLLGALEEAILSLEGVAVQRRAQCSEG